jgi:formylmethanofuran dehydrogenase subunit B
MMVEGTRTGRLLEDVACLGCGCVCDDIGLLVHEERIIEARNACALGREWFGDGGAPARALTAGRASTLEEALSAMARALTDARAPLVFLAPDITCEAQREGVAIADLLRGAVDSLSSVTSLASTLATQSRGRATATLGEIRNRADLVVFWGVDPAVRYPRFETRYAPGPVGIHLPEGRHSRTVLAVDVGRARGPADADLRISLSPPEEVAMLVSLAAALAAPSVTAPTSPGQDSENPIGALAERIRAARYVAVIAEVDHADLPPGDDARRAEALMLLSLAVNDVTRGALVPLRGGGNRPGAEAVVTAQTGFPLAVDFSRGYPRYEPWSATAAQLVARQAVDVVLVLGAPVGLPPTMTSLFSKVTTCVIGPRASENALAQTAAGAIDTGVPSVHEGGTVLRMDDLPLPVRGRISGPPSTRTITRALRERIVAMQGDTHRETTRIPSVR